MKTDWTQSFHINQLWELHKLGFASTIYNFLVMPSIDRSYSGVQLSNYVVGYAFIPAPPTPPPVGGEWVPIDKLQLLTPWTYWTLFATVIAVAFVFVKRTRKQQN